MDRWHVYGLLKKEFTKSGRVPNPSVVFDEFMTDEMRNNIDMYHHFCDEVLEGYREIGLVVERDQLHIEK